MRVWYKRVEERTDLRLTRSSKLFINSILLAEMVASKTVASSHQMTLGSRRPSKLLNVSRKIEKLAKSWKLLQDTHRIQLNITIWSKTKIKQDGINVNNLPINLIH